MAYMEHKLTEGCLAVIMSGGNVDKPILQILGSKKIPSSASGERYRLLVSDGKYVHSFAMLATQHNDKILRGELCEFTVIRVERCITSMVNNKGTGDKRVLIILDLSVLAPGGQVNAKLGNPTNLPDNPVAPTLEVKPTPMETSSIRQQSYPSAHTNNTNNANNISSMSSTQDHSLTHPIASLSPYQNKWVIKARVTSKSAIRTWSNARGEGRLFSMDLCDDSGEIRATAFKDQCDKFYDMIEVDKVYYISKCVLKPANKQYTNLRNDYEMTFTGETTVTECHDDVADIPLITFNLCTIKEVGEKDTGAIVDTIGVCKNSSDVTTLVAKSTGRELRKREVTLVDPSAAIELTLWGTEADNFDGSLQPVVLLKGAKVQEFGGGKSLSMYASTTLKLNPDITEAHKLRGWFDNGGSEQELSSLSARSGVGGGSFNTEWMSFKEASIKQLGNGDKGDYFMCKAMVFLARNTNAIYKACPQPTCNKKVIDQENGQYRCEKCNQEFPNFKYRLLMNCVVGDWSGSRWATCFTETAEMMLGKTSQEVGEELERDKDAAQAIFSKVAFKDYIFKLRVKNEFYGDTSRIKTTVVTATPVNYKEYNNHLINNLSKMTGVKRLGLNLILYNGHLDIDSEFVKTWREQMFTRLSPLHETIQQLLEQDRRVNICSG